MKRKPPSPLKRHFRGGAVTYDDLVDFRQLDEEQQFEVLEGLHRAGTPTEFVAVLSFFLATLALVFSPLIQVGLAADVAAGKVAQVIVGSLVFAFFLGFFIIFAATYLSGQKRRAHLYETFGLKQPQQSTFAELVASYQKPRRGRGWLGRRR